MNKVPHNTLKHDNTHQKKLAFFELGIWKGHSRTGDQQIRLEARNIPESLPHVEN